MDMKERSLAELQADFRASSTTAMPMAGIICWSAIGVAALFLAKSTIATMALYIMVALLPLAFLIEKARGRNLFAGGDNPLARLFLLGTLVIGLTVPLLVIGQAAVPGPLMVLGMAILAGLIWIIYGWAADDRSGVVHAVVRSLGCYAAYAFVPEPWTASAICGVVVVAYAYTLSVMRPTGSATEAIDRSA